ncbi:Csu type fimbrial protein [Taklimakanibacter lacteus]|uniref:Csu type fimbrial protein n=1 Tax=Taklimakanibacter lacteus TaxID=2268456 RepID=UPI000E66307C
MWKASRCLAYLVSLAGFATAIQAAEVTSNLSVTITITNECTAGATSPVNFGSHGVLNANFDATGNISVTCTTSAPYTIGLGAGTGSGATLAARKMTGPGSATVTYQLYRDSGRSLNWGDLASGDTLTGTGTGSAQTIDVYGRVASQTTPPAGTYDDTVLVTVSY